MIRVLVVLVLSLLLAPARASDPVGPATEGELPPAMALAQDYMQALTDRDYNQLARFYHRDTVLNDRMAAKKVTGRRDILAFLRRVHTYTQAYYFNIDHQFYKGSRVVLIGNYYYRARGDLFGYPGEEITFTLPGVTVLKLDLEKGRINEHEDLLDYNTMADQLSAHGSLRVD